MFRKFLTFDDTGKKETGQDNILITVSLYLHHDQLFLDTFTYSAFTSIFVDYFTATGIQVIKS